MITLCVLMPVFRRHRLANNAVACFLANTLPADVCAHLIVIDDGDTFHDLGFGTHPAASHHVHLWKAPRFPTLAHKYRSALEEVLHHFSPEIVAIFEDDDVYLPWHLGTHIEALRGKTTAWSKPSRVWTDYRNPSHWELEPSAGRFHASIAFTADVTARWKPEAGAAFDQTFMADLERECGAPVDPLSLCPVPGYCFRWHSGEWHAQHWMSCGDNAWYDKALEAAPVPPRALLIPEFDQTTTQAIAMLQERHTYECRRS